MRTRARTGMVSGCGALLLLLTTQRWPDWIERCVGVDVDGGRGTLEWLVVAAVGSVAVAGAVAAGRRVAARRGRVGAAVGGVP